MKRKTNPLAFNTQPNFVVDKIDHFNFDGDPLEYFSLKGVIKKVGTAIKNTAEDYGKALINNVAAAGRVVGLKTETRIAQMNLIMRSLGNSPRATQKF